MTARWTAEHFFIETTMTVAGLIAVLNWDSAFPDRRDVLVLAPLPVRASTLLLAKISALFAAPYLAMITLNLFIGFAWPLFRRAGDSGGPALGGRSRGRGSTAVLGTLIRQQPGC
jgi:hypothetical protein